MRTHLARILALLFALLVIIATGLLSIEHLRPAFSPKVTIITMPPRKITMSPPPAISDPLYNFDFPPPSPSMLSTKPKNPIQLPYPPVQIPYPPLPNKNQ